MRIPDNDDGPAVEEPGQAPGEAQQNFASARLLADQLIGLGLHVPRPVAKDLVAYAPQDQGLGRGPKRPIVDPGCAFRGDQDRDRFLEFRDKVPKTAKYPVGEGRRRQGGSGSSPSGGQDRGQGAVPRR